MTIVFDGMKLKMPEQRPMKAVYRSGTLLAIFPTEHQAEKYLQENSSIRAVEDHGFKFRIIPLNVALTLQERTE